MAKKNRERFARESEGGERKERISRLHPETRKSVWAIALAGAAVVAVLAGVGRAGPGGRLLFTFFSLLFGWGYFILPASLFFVAAVFLVSRHQKFFGTTFLGAGLIVLATLGIMELMAPSRGGWLGLLLGSLAVPFGKAAASVINVSAFLIGILVALNAPLSFRRPKGAKTSEEKKPVITGVALEESEKPRAEVEPPGEDHEPRDLQEGRGVVTPEEKKEKIPSKVRLSRLTPPLKDYVPPPASLLTAAHEKPTTGDLRANANIIKRTLESFGIPVEMGEINIGPTVTRYTLKPAEGVKLSRITALHQDLALALAAHPIRIEAPIPGKSLVGIEVPNKAAAIVRLGNLMVYQEFQKSGPLGFSLGRDVSGEPVFADIERMPHLLVAGATGSGKSVMIHSLLISLLYKNSPRTLKLILIDPKRVELSAYEGIPHLVSPVIVESKKALGVFRWAITEMERRYDLLLHAGSRDIKSYNINGGKDEPLPYLVIVVDELADLMTSYGREVEGSIIRLAQMARATGLHLILSTQRPSVEIITGLIKANITNRIALQVASQVDSRTILDMAGAEKLLGGGDLLFISSELSKPKRIQGSYVSEEEVRRITEFIRDNNRPPEESREFAALGTPEDVTGDIGEYLEDREDELYDEAVRVVAEAQKASASLLQRRLKVGYARAARLLDLMESNGIVGPGEGAKPREVFIKKS